MMGYTRVLQMKQQHCYSAIDTGYKDSLCLPVQFSPENNPL